MENQRKIDESNKIINISVENFLEAPNIKAKKSESRKGGKVIRFERKSSLKRVTQKKSENEEVETASEEKKIEKEKQSEESETNIKKEEKTEKQPLEFKTDEGIKESINSNMSTPNKKIYLMKRMDPYLGTNRLSVIKDPSLSVNYEDLFITLKSESRGETPKSAEKAKNSQKNKKSRSFASRGSKNFSLE